MSEPKLRCGNCDKWHCSWAAPSNGKCDEHNERRQWNSTCPEWAPRAVSQVRKDEAMQEKLDGLMHSPAKPIFKVEA
jgi:hypothetical protein